MHYNALKKCKTMRIYLTILLLGLSTLLSGQTRSIDTINFNHALDSNLIVTEIEGYSGKSKYQSIDGGGFYFGQCITIAVGNKYDSTLLINVPVGSILRCRDTLVQDMIITKSFDLAISPRQKRGYLIYAMCGEVSDLGPHMDVFYDFGGMAEPNVIAIAQLIEQKDIQDKIGQYAMWAVRNNADTTKFMSYGASYEELQTVVNYITEVGLTTKLTEQIPHSIIEAKTIAEVVKEEETKDEFLINRLTLILLGACGVLLIYIGYLITRPRNKPIV
jgi:hypothetical protein